MNRSRRSVLATAAAVTLAATSTVAVSGAAQAAWEPRNPSTSSSVAGQGWRRRQDGALDADHRREARSVVETPHSRQQAGGSGAEALVHLKQKTGDDHTIMVTLNSFYTTPLRQPGLDVDITTFTPIARMAEDTFLLWVHADSDINSVDEFVKAAKAAGNDWIMAGTGKGQEDQLLTTFLNSTYGLDMKYVPFRGGGRVAKELAGKHANSTVNNPSEQLGFSKQGRPDRSPRSPRSVFRCSRTHRPSRSWTRTSCTSCSAPSSVHRA